MTSLRWPLGLIAALWAVSAVRLVSLWPRLPDRMASHFNSAGNADGWMSRAGFVWFWVAMTGGLTLLLLTITRWVPWPLMNIPNKDYWSDPARQPLARGRMLLWCAWFAVGFNLLLAGVHELVLRANLMAKPHLSSNHTAFLIGFMIFVGLMLVVLFRQFRVPTPGP